MCCATLQSTCDNQPRSPDPSVPAAEPTTCSRWCSCRTLVQCIPQSLALLHRFRVGGFVLVTFCRRRERRFGNGERRRRQHFQFNRANRNSVTRLKSGLVEPAAVETRIGRPATDERPGGAPENQAMKRTHRGGTETQRAGRIGRRSGISRTGCAGPCHRARCLARAASAAPSFHRARGCGRQAVRSP